MGVREAQKLVYARRGLQGPCKEKTGKWGACGWAVVQMDYDEEMGQLYGMYGLMEAELEIQRTIKRVEVMAFVCLLKRVIGLIKVDVDNKRIIVGLRKGESIKSRAGDADLWIRNWMELHDVAERDIWWEWNM